MIAVTILLVLISCCAGTPLTAVWLSPIAPVGSLGQYETRDDLGGYHYAYAGPHHSKVETRLGGTTQGGYSYIDANGILQTVAYTANAQNGFRVQASNLPQQAKEELRPVEDTPEVAAAKQSHLEELRKADQQGSSVSPPAFLDYLNPAGQDLDNKLDAERSDLDKNGFILSKTQADQISKGIPTLGEKPEVIPLNQPLQQDTHRVQSFAPLPHIPHYVFPVVPYRLMHSSLRHTQDSLGQYDYTYAGDTSAKTESRSLDGTTRGAYSYIDANGLLQQVHYIADHNGFRVAATNLPEAK
ncbi:uncharacterized protein LOC124416095 [Diprion similis]|uniref:uncharacterized protein LOC124416095 n=1 Tax=Diprion similis TaxID=362088 RepID=UPI001EF87D12|nr:uncharacterized protein LOC124416095 [Diprion similis]